MYSTTHSTQDFFVGGGVGVNFTECPLGDDYTKMFIRRLYCLMVGGTPPPP